MPLVSSCYLFHYNGLVPYRIPILWTSFVLAFFMAIPAIAADTGFFKKGASPVMNEETSEIGLTIRGREERSFLKIADRDGNIFGSTWGTLQLFHADQDEEYRLDEKTNGFSSSSDYKWYRYEKGLRVMVGSLNNQVLSVITDIKERIPLGETLSLGFSYAREESLEANRNLVQVGLEKTGVGANAPSLFLIFHTRAKKASVDLETGGRYQWPHADLRVSMTFLDLFNDLTLSLDRSQGIRIDEEKDFTHPPFFVRALGEVRFSSKIRGEFYGGAGTKSVYQATHPTNPDLDFEQSEESGYAGVLLEWRPVFSTAAGFFSTFEGAEQRRSPMGQKALDLFLDEKEVRAGTYLLKTFPSAAGAPAISLEATLEKIWRPQEGQDSGEFARVPSLIRNVQHRDTETLSGLEITLPFTFLTSNLSRLDLQVGYFVDHRRTDGLLPDLSETNHRLKLRFPFRFTNKAALSVGANFDLDKHSRAFDGGSALLTAQF